MIRQGRGLQPFILQASLGKGERQAVTEEGKDEGKSVREGGNGQLLENAHHIEGTGLRSPDLSELGGLSSKIRFPESFLVLCLLLYLFLKLGVRIKKERFPGIFHSKDAPLFTAFLEICDWLLVSLRTQTSDRMTQRARQFHISFSSLFGLYFHQSGRDADTGPSSRDRKHKCVW